VRVTTGRVVDGKIVLEDEFLEDGATVTVLIPEDDETFDLAPEDKAELIARLREADQGLTIDASALLRDLERKRPS
jgi:hypothetical protein